MEPKIDKKNSAAASTAKPKAAPLTLTIDLRVAIGVLVLIVALAAVGYVVLTQAPVGPAATGPITSDTQAGDRLSDVGQDLSGLSDSIDELAAGIK